MLKTLLSNFSNVPSLLLNLPNQPSEPVIIKFVYLHEKKLVPQSQERGGRHMNPEIYHNVKLNERLPVIDFQLEKTLYQMSYANFTNSCSSMRLCEESNGRNAFIAIKNRRFTHPEASVKAIICSGCL